ncbi:MAG TPA: histidine ammonia-lyase [Casimicrobiaceae bacterium]|nr:histidine ammonia-lyase [Casimicrobiaceae bacterium]
MATVTLTGRGVTLADVAKVAREGVEVALATESRARVVAARAVVDRLAQSETPIYGVTTALGANTGKPIGVGDRAAYQVRAVQARAVGVGPPFATDVVRAMMFARAAGMAVGGSGVSPAVLDALVAMLNAGVHPVVPGQGSIGVADLPALSHLALPLLGLGKAEFESAVLSGADALALAGLAPIDLAAKDGIALISSNAATVGHAALTLIDVAAALVAFDVAAALSFEGFRANVGPLDARAQSARPAQGQCEIAAHLSQLLAGSELWHAGAARRVQDPLSFRCVSQVHGAALAALHRARDDVELELNSAADSPLVLVESAEMLSNGNFHITGLALAFDSLGLALAHIAWNSVMRCQKLYSPALSGLPLQLTTRGPEHSGFATLQKTSSALWNAIRHLANPASLDSLPVSESVEDHAPMAPNVVAKTAAMLPHLHRLAAIELLSGAQAIDLRGTPLTSLGRGALRVYEAVRERVSTLEGDRPLGPDVESIAEFVEGGAIDSLDMLAR